MSGRRRAKRSRPPRESVEIRPAAPPSPSRWVGPLAALVLLAVVPYLRCWRFDFVHLDDAQLVVEGAWFFADWRNLPRIFVDDVWHFAGEESSLYRPLLLLPRFFEWSLFQAEPGPYHVLNSGLHLVTVLLFFLLLRNLLGGSKWSFFWACLFALHPAHVPVVAWIEGYNNSMLAVFILTALLFALRALDSGRTSWSVLSALAFFAALLTKENAVCAPLLAVGVCYLHVQQTGVPLPSGSFLKRTIVAWSLALGAWLLLRGHAIPSTPELEPTRVLASVARGYPGLLLYWGKIFFPFNLSPLPVLEDSTLVFGALAAACYGFILLRSGRDHRLALLFGVAWFLVLISPSLLVSRLWSPTGAIFREDRLYQACLGPLLALAVVSRPWLERQARAGIAGAVAVAVAAVVIGQKHVGWYADGFAFYSAAVEGSPHLAVAHTHLADTYVARQDFDHARREYERALELNPYSPTLNNNFALLLAHAGEFERADRHFQAEIAVNPHFAMVYYNRGMLFGRRGDLASAAANFERFLNENPHSSELVLNARLGLVDAYTRLDRPERLREVMRALQAEGVRVVGPQGPRGEGESRPAEGG